MKVAFILLLITSILVSGCNSILNKENETEECTCYEVYEYHSAGLSNSKGELQSIKVFGCDGNLEEVTYYDSPIRGDEAWLYLTVKYSYDKEIIEIKEFWPPENELVSVSIVKLFEPVLADNLGIVCFSEYLRLDPIRKDICLESYRISEVLTYDGEGEKIGEMKFEYDKDWNVLRIYKVEPPLEPLPMTIYSYKYDKEGRVSNHERALSKSTAIPVGLENKIIASDGEYNWKGGVIIENDYTIYTLPNFGLHEYSYSENRIISIETFTKDGFPESFTQFEYKNIDCD